MAKHLTSKAFLDFLLQNIEQQAAWEALMIDKQKERYQQDQEEDFKEAMRGSATWGEVKATTTPLDNRAAHYEEGREYAPWKVIADWNLNFNTGNALKYISRYERKGTPEQDLRKAIRYLEMELENRGFNIR